MIRRIKRWGIWNVALLLLISCGSTAEVSQSRDVPRKAQKYFNEGYEAFQLGEFAQAELLFLKAIAKYDKYTDAYDALGKTYQVQGKLERAKATYRQLLEIEPQHLFALYELGEIYFDLVDLDSSRFFYQHFIHFNPQEDRYAKHVRVRLDNIDFAKEAMAHPQDITPSNLGRGVNSDKEEYSPALTIDESRLYYTHRDASVHYQWQNEDIWYSVREGADWVSPITVGDPINTAENEGAFSISADGRYIFFTACSKPGGRGECDLWLTQFQNGRWTEPSNLGPRINTRAWESQPSISSDGLRLYFSSTRPGGYGGSDLYVSLFTDSGWSSPQNLGPAINTDEDEMFPFIHSDGQTLYFNSKGHPGMGGADLYKAERRPDGSWSEPVNLGYPINSLQDDMNLIVGRDGKTAYYSSDRQEGYGGMDIYSFELPEELRARKVNYLKGVVVDADSRARIGAQVELLPLDGSEATRTFAPEGRGEFIVALRSEITYALHVRKQGYLFYSDHFNMPETDPDKPFELLIPLQKIQEGKGIVLQNIFFETDQSVLKPESRTELDKLLQFLMDNAAVRVAIDGHTDNVGSDAHNLRLSKARAQAVVDYLSSHGIAMERLEAQGFGSSRPIADNETVDGRAQNRRTEFRIIR